MRCIKRISLFCKRMSNEFKRVKTHLAVLTGLLFVVLGIFTWSFSNDTHKIITLFSFPKYAMPIAVMYILWSIVYFMVGYSMVGLVTSCEKYKRIYAQKISLIIFMSLFFTYLSYLIFFSAFSPFITFLMLLVSALFCLFAFVECKKISCLWTLILLLYFIWLVYNMLIPLGFFIIN